MLKTLDMLITRVRISWAMGGFMILWSIVSTLTAVAQDFKGLLLTRLFLGITEAPYYPGALYLLSIFLERISLYIFYSKMITRSVNIPVSHFVDELEFEPLD